MNQRILNFRKNNNHRMMFIFAVLIVLVIFTVMANLSYIVYRMDEGSFEIVEAEIVSRGRHNTWYIRLVDQGIETRIDSDFRERIGDVITIAYSEDGIVRFCRCNFIIDWRMVYATGFLIVFVILLFTRGSRSSGSNTLRSNKPRWERTPGQEKPPWEL